MYRMCVTRSIDSLIEHNSTEKGGDFVAQGTMYPIDMAGLVPPDEKNENDKTEWLDARLNDFGAAVRFLVGSEEFHTDPYSAVKLVMRYALEAAVNSPNIGTPTEEDELRGLLMHLSDTD